MFYRFAAENRTGPDAPLRPVQLSHLLGGLPFTLAIIPLLEVVVDNGYASEARYLTRLTSSLPGADKHRGKRLVRHHSTQPFGPFTTTIGQRNVSPARMPAVKTPFSLAVSDQPKLCIRLRHLHPPLPYPTRMDFQLVSEYKPQGDQPRAIAELVSGLHAGEKDQVLLGVTGSGKTFTMAKIIAELNRPALILAHNKTLAAQLYHEFKQFFPNNAVEYFVSYYDYYQPEAYIPSGDLYIEKESTINDELDKLRLSATRSLFERRDSIIVSSVSCNYGL